jgi:outer membrane protein assembly factor BamB
LTFLEGAITLQARSTSLSCPLNCPEMICTAQRMANAYFLVIVVAALSSPIAPAAKAQFAQQLFKLTPSNVGTGALGFSVGISGNTAIIGAKGDNSAGDLIGAAYLFDTTTGQELHMLAANDAVQGDEFGISVAINGDRSLVGAYSDNIPGVNRAGSVYVFEVSTGQQLRKLTASDAAMADHFGFDVALEGNTALIGARGDNGSAGSAYLFDISTGEQLFKLNASDAGSGDHFGQSVAISENFALVGAPGDYASSAAYLFDINTGQELHRLSPSDPLNGENFGASVSLSKGLALVGAPLNGKHSAYLFDVASGQQLRKFTDTSDFGFAVALGPNTALIGAPTGRITGMPFQSGEASLYDLITGQRLANFTGSGVVMNAVFGRSVALSNDIAVMGAPNQPIDGAAYIFRVTPLPGDFNGDAIVDAADYIVWRKGLETTFSSSHYALWRARFGEILSSSASADAGFTTLPEPPSVVVLLLLLAVQFAVTRGHPDNYVSS